MKSPYMDYYFYDYDLHMPDDDDRVVFKFTEKDFGEVWVNCVQPSFFQIIQYVVAIVCWNFTCRFAWICVNGSRIPWCEHIVSLCCGGAILYYTVGEAIYYVISFALFSYLLMILLVNVFKFNKIGYTLGAIYIIGLAICELQQANPKVWHKIRGIQMVCTMKLISLAFDFDARKIDKIPNIFPYMGYMFCPANCALGPWTPYDEYMAVFNGPALKLRWMWWALVNAVLSITFLILSNCIVSMLASDHSWKWLVAYRDALAFRCSHYFVSFLSQATMAACGMVYRTDDISTFLGPLVTKPWEIEFPRSLVQIVTNWNIPMHRWLKTYVFKVAKPHGTALAIFTTYLVSSLLHGLNFQLYAVLLSLGFYTFVEYNLRHKIASVFNACVLATSCRRNCSHEYKWSDPVVLIVNAILSMLSLAHLAYLGVMFEASTLIQEEGYSFQHALSKWQSLDFASHWIVFFCYIFYLLI